MKYVGYHRTSTNQQHLDRGIDEITKYCLNNNINLKKIYTDQISGTSFDRPRYTVLKEDVLEPGDVLIITEIDRLGRSKKDTLNELKYYSEHNIRVMILELPTTLIDLNKMENKMAAMMMETINNMLIEMYASFAQAENEKRKKRQEEGIIAKKERGEWENYGRPHIMSQEFFASEYNEVIKGNIKPSELIKKLGIKKSTFYTYRKNYLEINQLKQTKEYKKIEV